jgi:mono/diheme cytochrome c family protein
MFLAAILLVAASPAVALAQDDGQSRFLSWCSACHQATGQGVKGAFPALAGDAFVQGDPMTVASTVLNGRGGMPSFKGDLKDAEIAQILTYVRSSWGNTAGPVTEAQVAAARAATAAPATRGLQAH